MAKRKGGQGERELARHLSRLFSLRFYRSRQYRGTATSADVMCDDDIGIHWESKRTERLSIYTALDQAIEDCGGSLPAVAHRRNNREWLFICRLEDLPSIARKLSPHVMECTNV